MTTLAEIYCRRPSAQSFALMETQMQIKSIDPVSLKKRLDEGSTVLIDVREPHEHAREHIEGARLAPLSRFQG